MRDLNILISGASIAGPALAYWLTRRGARVSVVERAPALREGGQAVDFRGEVHMRVLSAMGIMPQLRAAQTHMRELRVVDERGRTRYRLPAAFASGDLEILRSDLSRILYEASAARASYLFGDQIVALRQDARGVDVQLAQAGLRRFDLVIGADGLHSGVRALAFGPDRQHVRQHGYAVAIFGLDNHLRLDHSGVIYSTPGRAAALSSARDPARATGLFVLRAPLDACTARDASEQRRLLHNTYAGMGWEVPRMLQAMWGADDFYFDGIAQVEIERYASGRVALLGDAAWGGTLGGQGTGLAVVGACLLAAELAQAPRDHAQAFRRYEQRMRAYAVACQRGSARVGPFYAPRSRAALWLQSCMYRALGSRLLTPLLERLVTRDACALDLPEQALA